MANEAIGDFRDVDETVLMDTDVHKGTEVDDVTHSAGELHAGLEVGDLHNIGSENGFWKLIADVTAGLHKLLHDIHQSRNADTDLFSGFG